MAHCSVIDRVWQIQIRLESYVGFLFLPLLLLFHLLLIINNNVGIVFSVLWSGIEKWLVSCATKIVVHVSQVHLEGKVSGGLLPAFLWSSTCSMPTASCKGRSFQRDLQNASILGETTYRVQSLKRAFNVLDAECAFDIEFESSFFCKGLSTCP